MIGWIVFLVVVAALVGGGFWLVKVGHWQRTKTFFGEVRSELKKVSFPSREEVIATTIVVIVTSFVFAIYLWAADMVIVRGYQQLIKVLGS